jgi:hypothetical protein
LIRSVKWRWSPLKPRATKVAPAARASADRVDRRLDIAERRAFGQRKDRPTLEECEPILDEGGPLAHRDLRIRSEVVKEFVAELM